jgi:hypothetical protein
MIASNEAFKSTEMTENPMRSSSPGIFDRIPNIANGSVEQQLKILFSELQNIKKKVDASDSEFYNRPISLTINDHVPSPQSRRTSVGATSYTIKQVETAKLDNVLTGDYIFTKPSESIFGLFYAIMAVRGDFVTAMAIETRKEPGGKDSETGYDYSLAYMMLFISCSIVIVAQGSLTWYIFKELPPLNGDPNFCHGSFYLQFTTLVVFFLMVIQAARSISQDLLFYQSLQVRTNVNYVVIDHALSNLDVRKRIKHGSERGLLAGLAGLIFLGEYCVLGGVFLTGARFLIQQSSAAAIVQGSVALIFILQIDDIAYDVFVPEMVKKSLMRIRLLRPNKHKDKLATYTGGYISAYAKAISGNIVKFDGSTSTTIEELANGTLLMYLYLMFIIFQYLMLVRIICCGNIFGFDVPGYPFFK